MKRPITTTKAPEAHSGIHKLVLASPALVLAMMSPVSTLNRFSNPKLAMLGVVASAALIYLSYLRIKGAAFFRAFSLIFIGFIGVLLLVFFLHPENRALQLFGESERNVGLLAFLSFSILAVAASTIKSSSSHSLFIKYLTYAGLFIEGYALLQSQGIDFVNWDNKESWVVSTLGNPNHISAFLGIFFWINFYYLIHIKSVFRFLYLVNLGVIFYLLLKVESLQGFVILLLSLLYLFWVNAITGRFAKAAHFVFGAIVSSGVIALTLGLVGFGPLAGALRQGTSLRRLELWQAGWNMIKSAPVLGSGISSYGWLFPANRTVESVMRTRKGRISNSAHNEIIDMAVSGGIVLLLAYLAIMVFVGLLAFRLTLKTAISAGKISIELAHLLVIIWSGALFHNMVSAPSLAIGALLFFTSGLVVAMSEGSKAKFENLWGKKVGVAINAVLVLFIFIFSTLPYINETSMISAMKARQSERVLSLAISYPIHPEKAFVAGEYLTNRGRISEAKELVEKSLEQYPNSIKLLKVLISLDSDDTIDAKYRNRIRDLDPFFGDQFPKQKARE